LSARPWANGGDGPRGAQPPSNPNSPPVAPFGADGVRAAPPLELDPPDLPPPALAADATGADPDDGSEPPVPSKPNSPALSRLVAAEAVALTFVRLRGVLVFTR
jgi:hypothetical protein